MPKTITNNFQDVELLNMNPDAILENRGPFLVIQHGIAPGDELQQEKLFVLRPDGKWGDFFHYATQTKPDALDEVVFTNSTAVMELLERLGPKPETTDLAVDNAALQAWLNRTSGQDIKDRLRHWLHEYHARHRADAQWS